MENQETKKRKSHAFLLFFLKYVFPILLVVGFITYQTLPFLLGKIHTYAHLSPYTLIEESGGGIASDARGKPLSKGQKVAGEFKATENNLGIVLLRFDNFGRINSGKIVFKIKERSSPKWYAENTYNVDQFQPNEYFTFGFPLISNSQGKTYQFEVTSLDGKNGNAVAISKKKSPFATVYNFSGSELKSDIGTLGRFTYKKLVFSFSQINYIETVIVFIIAVLLFLFTRSPFYDKNVKTDE